MLRLNKSTRIALYAMAEIARGEGAPVAASAIAETYSISHHHLSKVLQQLVRAGLLKSLRGVGGGHTLARDAKNITLYDIVDVFEGEHRVGGCLLQDTGEESCAETPDCGLAAVFVEIDEQVLFTLQSITLKTLISRKKLV